MTALAEQEHRQIARPLKVLEKLIRDDIEAGDRAGMEFYRAAGDKLNEAQEGYFQGDVQGFWSWAGKKFPDRGRGALRTWMASGIHRGAKTLTEVEKIAFGYDRPPVARRPYTAAVDDIAEKARREARWLANEEELTRKQERDAEAKLGLRLIDIGYRVLARELHPDKGGSKEAMIRLGRVRTRLRANV